MENKKMIETDLDQVTGGAYALSEVHCPLCNRYFPSVSMVKHNNRLICRDCFSRMEKK